MGSDTIIYLAQDSPLLLASLPGFLTEILTYQILTRFNYLRTDDSSPQMDVLNDVPLRIRYLYGSPVACGETA
jgi:hypothetical protein